MRTFRENAAWNGMTWPTNVSGDLTTWTYDAASGLVTSKTDAKGKSVNYTYTVDGKLASRTWARGIVTNYTYDSATGKLLKADYSDTTPDITYTYNRSGQIATIQDAAGSRTFTYDNTFNQIKETISGIYSKDLNKSYTATGMKGQIQAFAIGDVQNYTYTYDDYGRINKITTPMGDFNYTRLLNSDLISQMTRPNGVTSSWNYEDKRNLLIQVQNGSVSDFGYTNNAIGNRTAMSRAGSAYIVLDESFYTFRSVDKYFWMGSAWGTPNISFNYPLEDGRVTSNFQTYPDVTHISGFADSYDMTKDILIFLHGFNVDLTSAMTSNRIFFRRLYWSGYRDNYIGIAWNGIYGAEGALSKLNFDACVEQALRSSRSINKFLAELPKENNINIMAHSLGNLVMWDALRLERYKSAPSVLVFNIISIQAAIWSDMFLPCTSLDYSSEPDPSNNISYSIYDLQRHSWAFWLNQNSRSAFESYSGIFCNSLTFDDYALIAQKLWNATPNSDAYKRTDYATNYRTPYTLPLLYPLMKNGSRLPYNPVYADLYYKFITDPIGLSAEIGDKNVLATKSGWDTAAHSSFKDLEFYKIIRWYKQIFSTETQIIERD